MSWNVEGDPSHHVVEPLIFLPLIENAVKHSMSIGEAEETIAVNWTLGEGRIHLEVSNSIGLETSKGSGGFGLDNLKKRLISGISFES